MLRVPGESQLSILVGIGRIAHILAEKIHFRLAHSQPVCSFHVLQGVPAQGLLLWDLAFRGHRNREQEQLCGGILLPNFEFLFEITMQIFP